MTALQKARERERERERESVGRADKSEAGVGLEGHESAMEAVKEVQTSCKRLHFCTNVSATMAEEDEDGEGSGGRGGDHRLLLRPCHPSSASSRIFRASRASGGKDRHSKVLTARGLRDRRVRLSVPTAIQLYHLQARLGFDQPSMAVEWLIKAATSAIALLPSLHTPFPQPEPEPQKLAQAWPEHKAVDDLQHTKSACSSSSISETSKGSVLSLSQSETRIEDKDRDDGHDAARRWNRNPPNLSFSQSSFSELLTGGSSSSNWPATSAADYFGGAGLASGFSSQARFGSGSPDIAPAAAEDHPQMQHLSFLQDHLIPVAVVPSVGDCSLNFSISSSGLAQGLNRGTLQSNSPSNFPHHRHHHHHHRRLVPSLSSTVEGQSLPFFFGPAAPAPAGASAEHQLPGGFDGRLQLCHYSGYWHYSDLKGKGKG